MSSAYVTSKDLLIPMPFEDYLKKLAPYTTPSRYHDDLGFDLTVRPQGKFARIEASQSYHVETWSEGITRPLQPYFAGAMLLHGIISATDNNETRIHYTLDAQNVRNATARRDVYTDDTSAAFGVMVMLCFLFCGCFFSAPNILLRIFAGLMLVIGWLIYAVSVSYSSAPAGIEETRRISTDFENWFVHLMTKRIMDGRST